ncbi:hypothetical protein [Lactococcus petauri]|nr:hypothetical protein [Lactococcus petauri]
MKKILLPEELYDQLELSGEKEIEVVENNKNRKNNRGKRSPVHAR